MDAQQGGANRKLAPRRCRKFDHRVQTRQHTELYC